MKEKSLLYNLFMKYLGEDGEEEEAKQETPLSDHGGTINRNICKMAEKQFLRRQMGSFPNSRIYRGKRSLSP